MFVRQSRNTYIRLWKELGYIENQANHLSKVGRGDELSFLKALSREDQTIEEVKEKSGLSLDSVMAFIDEYERLWFLVAGDSPEELSSKEHPFSYNTIASTEALFKDVELDGKVQLDRPWLRSLQLEITSQCNERCIHCYLPTEKRSRGGYMSIERVKSIIDQFADINGLRVVLSGGEVLLHKNVFEIMDYCRQKDMMILLQSNVILLDDDKIARLKELDLFNVQISLYSTTPQIHDSITKVPGSWEKTTGNIKKLVQYDIPVLISCPVMKLNYKGYKEMIQFCEKLSIYCYVDYILMAQSDMCTDNLCARLSLDQTSDLIDDLLEYSPNFKLKLQSIKSEHEIDKTPFAQRFVKCDILKSNLGITVKGDTYPCPGWQSMVLGNVFKKPLSFIWYDSEKTNEIRSIKPSSFKQCAECRLHNYCDMCMVYNYNESGGDIFKVCDRFCETARLLNQKVRAKYHEING